MPSSVERHRDQEALVCGCALRGPLQGSWVWEVENRRPLPRVIQEAGCAAGTSHQRSAMASVATEAAGNTEGVVFFTSKHFGGKAL